MECAVVSNKQVSVVRQSIHDCVVCVRVAPAQCQCVERRSSGDIHIDKIIIKSIVFGVVEVLLEEFVF